MNWRTSEQWLHMSNQSQLSSYLDFTLLQTAHVCPLPLCCDTAHSRALQSGTHYEASNREMMPQVNQKVEMCEVTVILSLFPLVMPESITERKMNWGIVALSTTECETIPWAIFLSLYSSKT